MSTPGRVRAWKSGYVKWLALSMTAVALLLAGWHFGFPWTPFLLSTTALGLVAFGSMGRPRGPEPRPAEARSWISRQDHEQIVQGLERRTRALGLHSSIESFHRFRGFSVMILEARELTRLCEGTGREIDALMGRVRSCGQDGPLTPPLGLEELVLLRAQVEALGERITRVGVFSESQRLASQRALAATTRICQGQEAGECGELARARDDLALVAEGLQSLVGAIKP